MEFRAHHVAIGAFVLAVIVAAFGFIYWMSHAGGLGSRSVYRIQFGQPVPGLTVGSAVLFNGIRVGETTDLKIDPSRPQGVEVTIAVEPSTPVRTDTRVDTEYQGLAGVAAIMLRGGAADAPRLETRNGQPPVLVAGPDVGRTLTQVARDALGDLKGILDENKKPLNTTITGLSTFADMLARNSDRLEGVIKGLERMTGGGEAKEPPAVYDLTAPTSFPPFEKPKQAQIVVPDPVAVLVYDTQRILTRPDGSGTFVNLENAQWADTLPKLVQAKIVQSFANAGLLSAVSRPLDDLTANYRLVLELRSFELSLAPAPTAVVEFAARLLDDKGTVLQARIFKAAVPAKSAEPADAVTALNEAFGQTAKELVVWTVGLI